MLGDESPYWKRLDVSPCTSLKSFNICLYSGTKHIFSNDDNHFQWFTFLHLLSQIPNDIQTIVIALLHVDSEDEELNPELGDKLAWNELDSKLMGFAQLREVTFRMEERVSAVTGPFSCNPMTDSPTPLPQESKRFLQQLLPDLNAAGRMHFLEAAGLELAEPNQ